MHDVLIVGGGVVGLSLAWELARRGESVQVIDRAEPGREASWAGAGIISAAKFNRDQHPLEQLRGLACELHPNWAAELKQLTGIDNGYRRCGGLHLARMPGEAAALAAWAALMREEGIEVERVTAADLGEIEPCIARRSATGQADLAAAFLLPAEAQLRNPWHLQALLAACQQAGVTVTASAPAGECEIRGGKIVALRAGNERLAASRYCFTAGAWTGAILQQMNISVGVLPIRGQMVLFRCERPPITRIVEEGSRYLVPREDGRLLAGSTEEEVGFDKRTTAEAISDLTDFARSLVPSLRDAPVEKTWAGLRPASFDGLPYLAPLPGLNNAFVASGHYRNGLFLSTATAVVMSQLMRGEEPEIDLAPFRVGR